VDTKSSIGAHTALKGRVQAVEGVQSSHANDISNLQTTVATKASLFQAAELTSGVSLLAGNVTSLRNVIRVLSHDSRWNHSVQISRLDSLDTSVASKASQVSHDAALTRITWLEGFQTSATINMSNMENELQTKADISNLHLTNSAVAQVLFDVFSTIVSSFHHLF
jgi:hypothetical protein